MGQCPFCRKRKDRYNRNPIFKKQRKTKVIDMCRPLTRLRDKTPDDILKECGLQNTLPVNLSVILRNYEISCVPMDFGNVQDCDEILGALVTKGDRAAIFYSDKYKKDSHRCRFTIAHEIAHCCLNRGGSEYPYSHIEYRKDQESKNSRVYEAEREANVFAGELLIPEKPLMKMIKKLLFPSIKVLMDTFDVSYNVMYERLKYLGVDEKIYGYNA